MVAYGSFRELDSLDHRRQIGEQEGPSDTSIVHCRDYIYRVAERMREIDPEGKKAEALAEKYRNLNP